LNSNIENLEKIFYYEEIADFEKAYNENDSRLIFRVFTIENNSRTSEEILNPDPTEAEEIRKKVYEIYGNQKNDDESIDDIDDFENKYKRIDRKKYLYSFFDLCKYNSQRWIVVKLCFIWFVTNAVYQSIPLYYIYFKGSMEYNGMIYHGLECIFFSTSGYIINFKNIGRIRIIIVLQVISLVCFLCLFIFYLPGYFENVVIIIIALTFSGIYVTIYVYSYEVYPLVLSSKGFMLNLIFGKLGSLVLIMLTELLGENVYIVPCVLQAICVILIYSLPETVVKERNEHYPPERLIEEDEDDERNSKY